MRSSRPKERVRSGWNITEQVDFLEQLPVRAVLDGELVAFGEGGKPDFERVCERMLFRHGEIPLVFIVFDLLSVEGDDLRGEPYRQRRQILDGLGLDGPQWRVPEALADGPALWDAVCDTSSSASLRNGCTSLTTAASASG